MKLKKNITLNILNTNTVFRGLFISPSTSIPSFISFITLYAAPVVLFPYISRLKGIAFTRYPYTNDEPESVKSKNEVTCNEKTT